VQQAPTPQTKKKEEYHEGMRYRIARLLQREPLFRRACTAGRVYQRTAEPVSLLHNRYHRIPAAFRLRRPNTQVIYSQVAASRENSPRQSGRQAGVGTQGRRAQMGIKQQEACHRESQARMPCDARERAERKREQSKKGLLHYLCTNQQRKPKPNQERTGRQRREA